MRVFLVVLILLLFNLPTFSQDLCKVHIQPKKSGERTVLLMGGNAWDLFKAYLDELKKRNISYDLGNIKVKVWNGKELVTQEMTAFSLLTGEGPLKIWENKLKKLNAEYNESTLQDAYNLGWDVFCIPKKKPVAQKVAEPKKEPAKGVCSPEAEMHINLGVQFVKSKDLDNALREFKAAIQKSPGCPLAYANLANLYLLRGDYNLAVDTYKEGVNKAGDHPFLHYAGAVVYTKKGDYDYALQALEKALQSGFKDIDVLKKDKDLLPLKNKKRTEFCGLMLKYNIPLKECL